MIRSNNTYFCINCIFEKMKKKLYNKPFSYKKYLFKYIYTNIASFFPVVDYNRY